MEVLSGVRRGHDAQGSQYDGRRMLGMMPKLNSSHSLLVEPIITCLCLSGDLLGWCVCVCVGVCVSISLHTYTRTCIRHTHAPIGLRPKRLQGGGHEHLSVHTRLEGHPPAMLKPQLQGQQVSAAHLTHHLDIVGHLDTRKGALAEHLRNVVCILGRQLLIVVSQYWYIDGCADRILSPLPR